ncbi:polyprenyl synthetase family protein [Bacillus kwashiorkori]|uniref:polyprenyl synthetase family protein n=1 Tax=Bacillus kwashiorkori TaxID=1522318 RepID=UPI000783C804|nr:farnesyl diphosphate synthase [Bacillus kwashiorkori]
MEQNLSSLNMKLSEYVNRLDAPTILKDSMDYSIQAGGKRIRPLLILMTLEAFQKNHDNGLPVACAVEMVHTYSLIHDDLPSMDDDDFRRGKFTNHRVFGEANAILAGDALLTYAFQMIAESPSISDKHKVQLIFELAKAAGPEGMVAGQVADIEGENKTLSIKELEYIHVNKTGRLLAFCIKAGAILADAKEEIISALEEFSLHLGLAFQIRDDILDIEGSLETIGKQVGSDEGKQKATYPALLTLAGAKEKLTEHINRAKTILENLPIKNNLLLEMTELIATRNS